MFFAHPQETGYLNAELSGLSAEMSGFWSKLLEVGGNLGGSLIGMPQAGSIAVNTLGLNVSKQEKLTAKYTPKFQQMSETMQQISALVDAGRAIEANQLLGAFHSDWQAFKFAQPEDEQGFLYNAEQASKASWDQLSAKVVDAVNNPKTQANTTLTGGTQMIAGIDNVYIFGGLGLFAFLMLRR